MKQLPLFPPALTCCFGSPWGANACGPCAKCQAFADELAAAVSLGERQ